MKTSFLFLILFLSLYALAYSDSGKKEIIVKRDIFSKTYTLGNNTYQLLQSTKPLHYPDNNNQFQDINLSWNRNGNQFFNSENVMETVIYNSNILLADRLNSTKLRLGNFTIDSKKIPFPELVQNESNVITASLSENCFIDFKPVPAGILIKWLNKNISIKSNHQFIFDVHSEDVNLLNAKIDQGKIVIDNQFIIKNILFISDELSQNVKTEIVTQTQNKLTIAIYVPLSGIKHGDTIELRTYIERTVSFGGNRQSVRKTGDNYDWLDPATFIGVKTSNGDPITRYRETWNMNDRKIPDDAKVLEVIHTIDLKPNQNQNIQVEIVSMNFNTAITGNAKDNYQAIGSGSQYDTFNPSQIGDTYSHTYTTGQNLCTDIQNSLTNNGIFIGARLDDESGTGEVKFDGGLTSGATLQVTYSAPHNVVVKNDFEYGQVKVDNVVEDSPHETLKLWDVTYGGESISMEAIENQVYNDYKRLWKEWILPDGTTDPTLGIQHTMTSMALVRFTADFDKECRLTVEYDLMSGGTTNPDEYLLRENEHTEITVNPKTINVNGRDIEYNFSHWWDGNTENPRAFTTSVHVTHTATMKGHLASASSLALAGNGARKVWSTSGSYPKYFVVYEDNGDIYLTKYTYIYMSGFEWTDEELISDGTGNSSYPCIAAIDLGQEYCIVWQKYNPSTQKYEIIYRSSEDWTNPVSITTNSTSAISRPVVGVTAWNGWYFVYYWMFAWDNGNGLKFYDTYYQEIINIPETDASCHNVTITNDPDGTLTRNGIAWQNEGHIYFIEFGYHETPENFTPENVTSGYSYFFNSQTPSIASDYGQNGEIMLTWCAETDFAVKAPPPIDGTSGIVPYGKKGIPRRKDIFCRKNIYGSWDPPTQILFQNYQAITPVVGSVNDDFVLLWKAKNYDFLARLDYNYGSGWGSEIVTYPGEGITSPSISTSSWDISAAWSLYEEVPFRIHHEDIEDPSEAREVKNDSTVRYDYRTASLDLSQINSAWSGSLTVVMSHLVNRTQHAVIPFAPDSLYPATFLASDRFRTLQNNEEVKLKVWVYADDFKITQPGELGTNPFFRILLRQYGPENESKSDPDILYEALLPHSIEEGGFINIFEKEITLHIINLTGRWLEIEAELFPDMLLNQQPAYTEVLYFQDTLSKESSENTELLSSGEESVSLIKNFALYPAYPNPFNPTTTISFDLPEDALVKLAIYDVTGRRIRMLTSSRYPAGLHRLQWDGKDEQGNTVASGIYVYRIVADSQGDAGNYIQSRKMMLLK